MKYKQLYLIGIQYFGVLRKMTDEWVGDWSDYDGVVSNDLYRWFDDKWSDAASHDDHSWANVIVSLVIIKYKSNKQNDPVTSVWTMWLQN